MVLKIKLRVSRGRIKPFVSQVSTHGRVQKAFAEQIGKPVGACVAANVHKGMGIGDIKKAVRNCAKDKKGTGLSF